MYRYRIRGEGFEFDHEEEDYPLREGDIVTRDGETARFKVTRITKEARSMFGFSLPLIAANGSAEAERFTALGW
jgi:hypothetical protein